MISAWTCKTTALINILIVIPIVYLSQISPWCIPNKLKSMLCPLKHKKEKEKRKNGFIDKFRGKIGEFSYFNPSSYQGILIFAYIASVLSLYLKGVIKTN